MVTVVFESRCVTFPHDQESSVTVVRSLDDRYAIETSRVIT